MRDFVKIRDETICIGDKVELSSITEVAGVVKKICNTDFLHVERQDGVTVGISIPNIKKIRRIT